MKIIYQGQPALAWQINPDDAAQPDWVTAAFQSHKICWNDADWYASTLQIVKHQPLIKNKVKRDRLIVPSGYISAQGLFGNWLIQQKDSFQIIDAKQAQKQLQFP